MFSDSIPDLVETDNDKGWEAVHKKDSEEEQIEENDKEVMPTIVEEQNDKKSHELETVQKEDIEEAQKSEKSNEWEEQQKGDIVEGHGDENDEHWEGGRDERVEDEHNSEHSFDLIELQNENIEEKHDVEKGQDASIKESDNRTLDSVEIEEMGDFVKSYPYEELGDHFFSEIKLDIGESSYLSEDDSLGSSYSNLNEPVSVKNSLRDLQIDRNMYYEMYMMYSGKHFEEKTKNNILQSRLADYYKRKKMFHALHIERYTLPGSQKIYEDLLTQIEKKQEERLLEESNLKNDVDSLRNKFKAQKEKTLHLFEKFQKIERDYTRELSTSMDENAKANMEKSVNHLLKRQKTEISNLAKMRHIYIKLKNRYNEAQEELDLCEKFGSKYHLIDYEELKTRKRNLQDKFEEKEMALSTLRRLCQHSVQVLAHSREKIQAVEMNILHQNEALEEVTMDWTEAREQLTTLTNERNYYRQMIKKLKDGGGLLLKPKLLKDLEQASEEIKSSRAKLKEYKEGFSNTVKMLEAVRRGFGNVTIDVKRLKNPR